MITILRIRRKCTAFKKPPTTNQNPLKSAPVVYILYIFSFTFQVLSLKKIRIKFSKPPVEIQAKHLGIAAAKYILGEERRF